jgi:hypothetical protein
MLLQLRLGGAVLGLHALHDLACVTNKTETRTQLWSGQNTVT